MQTLFAWILIGCIILAAYPWSAWLISRTSQSDKGLTLLLTLALSTGSLTLLMFWESLVGIPFNLWAITLPYFVLMLSGLWLWKQQSITGTRPSISNETHSHFRRLSLLILVPIGAAVLFNGVYWPFYRDDTLGIYHRYGVLMYETGSLVSFSGRDDAFYQAYPMQIPLLYTYTYIASGWVNEYLAKTITTLLSLACLPTSYVLGRMMYSSLAGWLAALLLALMPSYVRWSSSGYVDLPMAFFYTLAAVFAWRLWKGGTKVDALLAGITIGFAAWTKNAALVGIGCMGLWLFYAWVSRRVHLANIFITLGACAAVTAPWYMRNFLEAGLLVPPTAWTDQAERTLSTLLVLITQPENFALSGWLILFSLVAGVFRVIRNRAEDQASVMLLIWTVPFFFFWWVFASYDPRFVLLFLPPLAVLAGGWVSNLWTRIPVKWMSRLQPFAVTVMVVIALYIVWISVEYKNAIVRNPLMGDEAKHQIVIDNRK